MPKFNLVGKVTITTFTSIVADTLEEAIQEAENRHDMMSIASNNGDSEDDVWMIEEIDGKAFDIKED